MDRRTEYTINVIKEAFLELIQEKGFIQMTIADICRAAGIHRSTFYLHFTRKDDVLEVLLEEAFEQVENAMDHICGTTGNTCKLPLCVFIRENKKYQPIFRDVSLGNYIIGKLAAKFKEDYIMELCRNSYYSREEAETLFWFQIHGCFSLAVHNIHLSTEGWAEKKTAIDKFIIRGSGR